MLVVPAATPDTMPVVEPIVATPVALLLHVPPAVLLASVIVRPTQTLVAPVIAESAFTVIVFTALQLPGNT